MVYPHVTPSPLPSYQEMLSIAEGVFAANGSTFSSSILTTIGDQSLFLDQEEDSMRWFLLPSDIITDKKAPPPFTPHQYPNPLTEKEPVSADAQQDINSNDKELEMHDANVKLTGRDKVCFHSPPKSIFSPTLEVNTVN